jgi:molybdenum cofactor cytidylyltransferase
LKIAGIILAAGESRRLGTAKQLLIWLGKPLIWHVARLAINSKLDPIIMVTGCRHADIEAAVKGMPVVIAYNKKWKEGQSSSIKRGLSELPETIDACIFFLSDQPQIPLLLVQDVIKMFFIKRSEIVAPRVSGRRGNPVLFGHSTFTDLLNLKGDEGGRKIFDRHRVEYKEWDDEMILLDVDTEESYQILLRMH